MKKHFSDITETEFKALIKEINIANDSASDAILNCLLEEFERITQHPAGADLFYYPMQGADQSDEGIAKAVIEWRAVHGLPGLKEH